MEEVEMTVSGQEQKQERLKQFLNILSEDPSLLEQNGLNEWRRPLSELLIVAGYRPWNEPVDMARLLSHLLNIMGYQSSSEDMMKYVMNGGTVDEFMNRGTQTV